MGAIPTGDESLQLVAVGAAEEVTNPSTRLMERSALGESAIDVLIALPGLFLRLSD